MKSLMVLAVVACTFHFNVKFSALVEKAAREPERMLMDQSRDEIVEFLLSQSLPNSPSFQSLFRKATNPAQVNTDIHRPQ